jgi:N-methylhydantoinase B
MIDVIFSAASQAAPERVVANAYGTINALSIAGRTRERPALGDVQLLRRRPWRVDRERWAEPRQCADFHGDDPADGDPGSGLSGDVPAMGAAPRQRWAGMHRGGLGAIYEIELLEEHAEAFLFGERGRFAPQGVAGGSEAAMNVSLLTKPTRAGLSLPLASKMVGIPLKRAAVRLETPGGGGYGHPKDREPSAVARDVALGYLSESTADDAYGPAWRGASHEHCRRRCRRNVHRHFHS